MSKIRVLVVEDSVTVRTRLVEVLSSDPEIQVVGEAAEQGGSAGVESTFGQGSTSFAVLPRAPITPAGTPGGPGVEDQEISQLSV